MERKKQAFLALIVAFILLGIVLAPFVGAALHNIALQANLGTITSTPPTSDSSSPPQYILIQSGTLNGATQKSVSTDGKTINFYNMSLQQGGGFNMELNVTNTGTTTGVVEQTFIQGLEDPSTSVKVVSVTAMNQYPYAIAAGATVDLTFYIEAIGVGSCSPILTIETN